MTRQTRVIVLGGGVSGLACARELVQRGFEVLVVEARSRVGGRLKAGDLECTSTSSTGEEEPSKQPIDLGGALIHGIDKNPIHSVATQMGIPLHPISDFCLLLDENGWPFDPKEDNKLSTLFNECLDSTFARAENDKDSSQSFGALFDSVCQERGVSPDHPLLKWHQANLELPSGCSFHDLGYTWNDDEPYGFVGAHVALEPSWRAVMDGLASGLDILFQSPVTQIRVLLPDGTTATSWPPTQPPEATAPDQHASAESSAPSAAAAVASVDPLVEEQPIVEPLPTETNSEPPAFDVETEDRSEKENETTIIEEIIVDPLRLPRSKRSMNPTPKKSATTLSPTRFSRRVRGDDANVRRSSRATKGVIQMLQVGHGNALSYDDPTVKQKQRRKRKREEAQDGEDDAEDNEAYAKGEEEVKEEAPSSTVQVTLQNGTILEADAIVCTFPLGILKVPPDKQGHIRFSPPLPLPKQQAIQRLGCGLLNKCAMSFPSVFWQNSDFLGLAGSDHSYLVLNGMAYTGKPILVFMYGGAFAAELESWIDSDIVDDCLAVLKKICGKDVPAPVDYCVTRWGKEQYSKMAFTYIPPGVDGMKELNTMSEAIYDPVLPEKPLIMFAGEHTTPYHPSTIHGAFLSGIREAYRLDLFVEPALNDNMVFEANDKLYQHTFGVRRLVRKPKKEGNSRDDQGTHATTAADVATTQTHHRRRRGAGIMTLRKQPKTVIGSPAKASMKKVPAMSPNGGMKSRRSNRSLVAKKIDEPEFPSENSEKELEQDKKNMLNALEDRILLRSLESYGRDVELVKKVLPVFGSTRKRTVDKIRSRWQQLKPRKESTEAWKKWVTEKVAIAAPEETISAVEPRTDADGNRRRSLREARRKSAVDVLFSE
jgi:monoamine oxidase